MTQQNHSAAVQILRAITTRPWWLMFEASLRSEVHRYRGSCFSCRRLYVAYQQYGRGDLLDEIQQGESLWYGYMDRSTT